MSELVDDLRETAEDKYHRDHNPGVVKLCREAADRIEALEAERDAAHVAYSELARLRAETSACVTAARAERDRLREALEEIIERDWYRMPEGDRVDGQYAGIARAALSPTPER